MLLQNGYYKTLFGIFDNLENLLFHVEQYEDLPDEISRWLARLKLLYGVPLNYLVPDENMLPAESIRFFYLDENWVNALVDGAFSIGRSFDINESANSFKMDKASTPLMKKKSGQKATGIRSEFLGLATPEIDTSIISGFLLRSSVVTNYPGLGVNVYSNSSDKKLEILRMERLTPSADVLLCLIAGEVHKVEIHEAPEALHYGVDILDNCSRKKKIYPFTKENKQGKSYVTMEMDESKIINMELDTFFRKEEGARTINMALLAKAIGEKASPDRTIDSSEMGFEMTEGVGMVSFYK